MASLRDLIQAEARRSSRSSPRRPRGGKARLDAAVHNAVFQGAGGGGGGAAGRPPRRRQATNVDGCRCTVPLISRRRWRWWRRCWRPTAPWRTARTDACRCTMPSCTRRRRWWRRCGGPPRRRAADKHGCPPLHEAVANQAPVEVVAALLAAYPDGVKVADSEIDACRCRYARGAGGGGGGATGRPPRRRQGEDQGRLDALHDGKALRPGTGAPSRRPHARTGGGRWPRRSRAAMPGWFRKVTWNACAATGRARMAAHQTRWRKRRRRYERRSRRLRRGRRQQGRRPRRRRQAGGGGAGGGGEGGGRGRRGRRRRGLGGERRAAPAAVLAPTLTIDALRARAGRGGEPWRRRGLGRGRGEPGRGGGEDWGGRKGSKWRRRGLGRGEGDPFAAAIAAAEAQARAGRRRTRGEAGWRRLGKDGGARAPSTDVSRA